VGKVTGVRPVTNPYALAVSAVPLEEKYWLREVSSWTGLVVLSLKTDCPVSVFHSSIHIHADERVTPVSLNVTGRPVH